MNGNFEPKKFGADKIAFLGMFALSLLIAQLIVSRNSALNFSEPIELAHSGLSISVPTGKGWQSELQWQYHSNGFTLSSHFIVGPGISGARVRCRYFPTSLATTAEVLFEQQAAEIKGTIKETGQSQKDNLTIYWARIEGPVLAFVGTVELPNNRTVNIEVIQTTFEINLDEKVFEKVIESLHYEQDNLVKNGAEIVKEIQSRGIDSFISDRNQQTCFFIQDSENNNIGFSIDVLGESGIDEQFDIKAANHLYMTGPNTQEQVSIFIGDNNLEKYIWQSETNVGFSRKGTEITRDETGAINVIRQTDTSSKENSYLSGSTVIPSVFLELLVRYIIENDANEIVIDVIEADGYITPRYLSFRSAREDTQTYSYVVILEFLDGRGVSELIYLDTDKQITKILIQQERIYNLERTDIESIAGEFPERASDILKRKELLENEVF